MIKKLDRKDHCILSYLLDDSRASFSEIGRHCKMSRQSVFSRMKSLQRKNIIKRFTVELDNKNIDLNLKAYILIIAEPQKEFRKKAEEILKKFTQISQIHYIYGRFDVLLEVLVRDTNELTSILKKIHELEMIKKTETFIVYDTVKYESQDPLKMVLT